MNFDDCMVDFYRVFVYTGKRVIRSPKLHFTGTGLAA
jgi:hypothetical protein